MPFSSISADKHVFIVEKKVAIGSAVIRTMLGSAGFIEARGEIEFEDISQPILERVIQYLHYKARHHGSKVPIPGVCCAGFGVQYCTTRRIVPCRVCCATRAGTGPAARCQLPRLLMMA